MIVKKIGQHDDFFVLGGLGEHEEAPDTAMIEAAMRVWHHNARLLTSRTQRGRFEGKVLVLRASDTRARLLNPPLHWLSWCPSTQTIDADYRHADLFRAAAAPGVTDKIVRWLGKEVWHTY
ncbi:MAG: hypothetical protein AAGB11_13445 [Pseudomonadota bacterium]